MLRLGRIAAPILVATIFYVSPAYAQATRTWVSGVGDDANPCSRTAPCKTFAGAISKTAPGGEINCLDPGGFGGVTITKALMIRCDYTEGGVLVAGAGVNGIVINAPATADVYLSGLDIFGAGSAQNGVRFIAGNSLTIENCVIRSFNAANGLGISFQPSGASSLSVSNCTIGSNGSGATGGGILIQPTGASGNARVVIDRVNFAYNANVAIRVDTTGNTSGSGIVMDITNSQLTGSSHGLTLNTPAGTTFAVANITNSRIFSNPGNALQVNGSLSVIRASGNLITSNGFVTSIAGGGQIRSYGDNILDGNNNAAAFTAPNLTKG